MALRLNAAFPALFCMKNLLVLLILQLTTVVKLLGLAFRTIGHIEPVPAEVHAVLAQRLFVDKTDLPSPLLNQIKRLAAFQNPEFYKKQSMRLSTALTPRVISCAEEFPKHIALPRGCQDGLAALLQHYGSTLAIDDQRHPGEPFDVRFDGKLTAIQKQAVTTLCKHDTGVFVAPPGIGKTVIGTWLIAERQCRDGHHPIIEMQLGPVRFIVDARNQAAHRLFNHTLIIRETRLSLDDNDLRIQDVYRRLATDEQRNNQIFNDVLQALE